MNDKWARAPIPSRLESKAKDESQLGQLIRWWFWIKDDRPVSMGYETLNIGRNPYHRGLRAGETVEKLILALTAHFYEELDVEVSVVKLARLSELTVMEKGKQGLWRDIARELQDAYIKKTTPRQGARR